MNAANTSELGSATPVRSARRLRRWALFGGACLFALVLGWYVWRSHASPPPPVIDLEFDDDPPLAQAVAAARQQVLDAPHSADAWGRLGQLLLAHAYIAEAKPCLAQAEMLNPTDPRWPYLQGWGDLLNHPEEAAAGFERAVARAQGDPLRQDTARLRLAQTLLDRGEFDNARVHFGALVDTVHATVLAHLGLGSITLNTGDLDDAIMHLEIAVASPLCRKRAGALLATAYRRRGQQALADDWDRRARAVRKDAEWPDPFLREGEEMVIGKQMRMLRAENLLRDGQWPQAAEQFRRIIDDYSRDTRSRVKLAMVLMDLHRHQDAEPVLRELLHIDPGMVQGHFLLSAVLFQEAERYVRNPADANQAQARFAESADQARQALALQPTHGFAYVYLGLSLRQLGQMDEALAALENAVRCNPEAVDPHLHLGETLAQAGRRSEALDKLEHATRIAPASDLRPQEALKRLRQGP